MAPEVTKRHVVAITVVVLLLPTVISGLTYALTPAQASVESRTTVDPANVTVVTSQGADQNVHPHPGRMVGVSSADDSVVWVNDQYLRYFDVDPLNNRTLQFVAHERQPSGELDAYVVTWDWVNNETIHRFEVQAGTRDVDRIGLDRYAVADMKNDRAYVYDVVSRQIVWQYNVPAQFPGSPDAGPSGDDVALTHIDLIDDGDTVLLGARNLNSVIAVNWTTKAAEWILAARNDTSILDHQHHAVVIEDDPLTVLVGDSRNDRVVEYRRTDGDWEVTWSYSTGLSWPRTVERLPNGNTLVADSGNDRVVEVTPRKEVVWEYHTDNRFPSDVERIALGDESDGPTMASLPTSAGAVPPPSVSGTLVESRRISVLERAYRLAAWVLPIWIGETEFVTLVAATLLGTGWIVTEIAAGAWHRFAADVYGEGLFHGRE